MIDYIALTIGHALLGLAFWHLFGRDSVDSDPLIDAIENEADERRREAIAGRRGGQAAPGTQDGAL